MGSILVKYLQEYVNDGHYIYRFEEELISKYGCVPNELSNSEVALKWLISKREEILRVVLLQAVDDLRYIRRDNMQQGVTTGSDDDGDAKEMYIMHICIV